MKTSPRLFLAPLTQEESGPLPAFVSPAEILAASRALCEAERREQREERMRELGIDPPDWRNADEVREAEEQARISEHERVERAVERGANGRVLGMKGTWLYGRFMTMDEAAAEFERREGRPMGAPLTGEQRADLQRRPHAHRRRRRSGG